MQLVREKGVEPEWEGPGVTTSEKGLVYVLDNFDCPDFKLLSGKCRCVLLLLLGAYEPNKHIVHVHVLLYIHVHVLLYIQCTYEGLR